MESSFDIHAVKCYSNFMKYTISNTIYNLILLILENSTILFVIDLMTHDSILGEVFTPLHFLSPHLYVEMLNEQFTNECNSIFDRSSFQEPNTTSNTTTTPSSTPTYDEIYNQSFSQNANESLEHLNEILEESTEDMFKSFNNNPDTHDLIFFGNTLYQTHYAYCVYSSNIIYLIIGIISLATICFGLTFFINMRNKPNFFFRLIVQILVNFTNIILRPLFIIICIVLMNRPIVFLYKSGNIKPEYKTEEIIYTLVSLLLLIYAVVFCLVYTKYINNIFYFEQMPYDSFSADETLMVLVIKVMIGFKLNSDKLLGVNAMSFINLIIGLLLFVRTFYTFGNREYIVNHVALKNFSTFLSFFYCFYILLKLLNDFVKHLKEYSTMNLVMELLLIIAVLIILSMFLLRRDNKFVFKTKDSFIVESMQFMYYVSRNLNFSSPLKNQKDKREDFFDNVIIGHKMKCQMENCIICCEDIYNPDLKTLCMILYQQFLQNEKEFKEEDEGLTLMIKLMYLKMIDEDNVHRISFIILKNLKNKNLGFDTMLKIRYMYENNLDQLNENLQGLLTLKYSEMNNELLECIKNFEEILGFIKSRTEKVELVTNKTNLIGKMYSDIIGDLHYLKDNKRIHFEPTNLLSIICIVRLVFPRLLDSELTENLDYNFIDFLEIVDKVFSDNISFLVKYDFNNRAWRIKKIPKKFIDMTNYKVGELLDQSLEKIFPKNLAKSRIKKLENELILANVTGTSLEFKTVICDSETNARYVRFVIDIFPNLENAYMLYMHCHFHKRQLLIIDEFGNFVNGCQMLYEKVGINADIVAASKGRINMFTMFNLDKKQKLEDVKIVSICSEGVVDATKNLFLLENDQGKPKQTTMPNFLDSFIKNEAAGGIKKDKCVVFLHLFSKETINEIKYYIYNIKISNPEEKQKKKREGVEGETKATIKRLNTDYSGSSEEKEPLQREGTTRMKEKKNEEKKDDDINTYQNYVNYYNTFYVSQHSMSMTMNYKANYESYNSSQANSTNSDVFSYLYMKAIGNKSHSNKFETFIYGIFLFNISLVLFGLASITYIKTYSNNSLDLIEVLENFYSMTNGIYKSTNDIFSYLKYINENEYEYRYESYIKNNLSLDSNDVIDYDNLCKLYLEYDLSTTFKSILNFKTNAFNYIGESNYKKYLDFIVDFIHLEPSGSYSIKRENMKIIIELITLTINQLSNRTGRKIFLDISYLEYEYDDPLNADNNKWMHLIGAEPGTIEKNYFTELINVYQHLFNYFNAYLINFSHMGDYLHSLAENHFDSLHNTGKSLLIVVLILNIIFVLICLFSIIIYRKILKKEFRSLYGLSEDSISKLKEKYQYVKELIKWEQPPSKIYEKIRKMREEIDQAQLEEKMKQKRKERNATIAENQRKLQEANKNNPSSNNNNINKNNDATRSVNEDNLSVLTTGSTNRMNDYLRFSGAVKGLFRSSTLRAKEQLKKLSKETRKQKASQDLLKRLNFDFEMIQSFIFFIVFMTLFYLIIGILVIIISDSNFKNVETSLSFTQKFQNKFYYLFNFYSATKLSIIFNKKSPYTIYNGTLTPECNECIFDFLFDFSSISGEISKIAVNNGKFNIISNFDQTLQGKNICDVFYTEYRSDLKVFLVEQNLINLGDIPSKLTALCKGIPILNSNVDSIITHVMVYTRKIYSQFLSSGSLEQKGEYGLNIRVHYLEDKFIETDLIMSLFVNFYYEYIYQNEVSNLNRNITQTYYSFMIGIFVINIFIDFFMILFIWFKMYTQIIDSVNNVQLVTDSVSIV